MSDLLKIAGEVTESTSPSDIAGISLHLAREVDSIQKILDSFKTRLREEARNFSRSGKVKLPVSFGGSLEEIREGEVSVTFQRDRISLTGEPGPLKEALGEDTFNLLFEEKRTYLPRKDILSLLQNLPESKKSLLRDALKVSEETPRVGFKWESP